MTYTVLYFLPRLPSLSPSEFKAYYENNHVKLIKSLNATVPDPSCLPISYVRRFLDYEETSGSGNPGIMGEGMPQLGFDVVTELKFRDKEAARKYAYYLYELEENAKRIKEDEEHFIVRSGMRGFAIDERV